MTSTSRAHIDATAGGAFFSLTVNGATATQEDDMHTVEETNMLAAELDLLIKRLDKHGTVQSLYWHIPREVCENFGHLGNNCLETYEDALNNNNEFRPQGGLGWNQSHPQNQVGNCAYSNLANQPSLEDLVLGQAQINELPLTIKF
jgi:hypothetical protein